MGDSVDIRIDFSEMQRATTELGKPEQFNFAASLTLNNLVYAIQKRIWDRMFSGAFHIRREKFNKGGIYFPAANRATTKKLFAILEIKQTADNLIHLETGDPESPLKRFLLVPNPEVFGYQIIGSRNKLHPKNLDLKKGKYGTGGNQRTYMINSRKTGTPLILQRMGSGKRGTSRLLYTLVKRIKVPAKLHFYEVADQGIASDFEAIAQRALDQAISTARR